MSIGILYVVYGQQYANLSVASIKHGRRHSDVDICIVTNINGNPWKGIPSIHVKYFDRTQAENRVPKLRMRELTPFDKTLYIDCDTVIQRNGVEVVFELLDNSDLCLNHLMTFADKVPKVYKKCMDMVGGMSVPMKCYNGGIVGFSKNEKVTAFFELWYKIWKEFAHGREMPPLNCAIQKMPELSISCLPLGFFAPASESNDAVIQHNWNMHKFCKKFSLPLWKEYKPFNNEKNKDDFRWVVFP